MNTTLPSPAEISSLPAIISVAANPVILRMIAIVMAHDQNRSLRPAVSALSNLTWYVFSTGVEGVAA